MKIRDARHQKLFTNYEWEDCHFYKKFYQKLRQNNIDETHFRCVYRYKINGELVLACDKLYSNKSMLIIEGESICNTVKYTEMDDHDS